LLASLVALLVTLAPLSLASGFFAIPLFRRRRVVGGDFVKLGIGLSAVPSDGTPLRVAVRVDKQDAWSFSPKQPVGSIWIRRAADGSIVAFSTICPHLGCSVEFRSGQRDFFCPCHNSNFSLAGKRLNQIPPRGMDELEVRVQGDRILVRYVNFRGGLKDRVPV
jgi:Rieske Fe-S protein